MKILLTSAGRRGYLVRYFKEAVKDGEIHVANSDPYATAMHFADESIVTPLIYEKTYIPFLLKYCEENSINAIVPLFDIDLPVLSKSKRQFEGKGVSVIVSNEEVIRICNDKWETYNFLKRNGFRTPITFRTLKETMKAVNEGSISFPLMLKPRWGMGSLLVFDAENEEELLMFYKKIKRNIPKTYLNYEAQKDYDKCVIIQEKIVGEEYGLDIINDLNGQYQNTVSKIKIGMRAGETDCSETTISEELQHVGQRLGQNIGHIGNLDVDIFLNEKGVYILEMNARFGGGYPFSHMAGVNLPKAIVGWLQGRDISCNLLKAKSGVVGFKDINVFSNDNINEAIVEMRNKTESRV